MKGRASMGRTENTELTVLCMVYKDNKILLQNRVKEDWKGYTFPGGHVEANESFVEAVIREMREETGLTIIRPRLCGVKQFPIENGRYVVFLFKTDEFTGELHSSEEGRMEWIDRDKLSSCDTVEDFEELMRVMEDEDLTEFQYTVHDDQWNVRMI